MGNIHAILNVGQVIKVSDADGGSWSLGIKGHLAGRRILCTCLDEQGCPPYDGTRSLKLEVAHEAGVYTIPASVAGVLSDTREIKLRLDQNHEFVQRRDFYRLPAPELQVTCRMNGDILSEPIVLDISGGGIGLSIDRPAKEDTPIEMQITLPDATATAIGRVVRCSPSKDENRYLVGVSFTKISKADRAKIIKHIFKKQQLSKERLGA